jgi:hypothetical protein
MIIDSEIKTEAEENFKYIFTAIEDPLHYANILKKENFSLLEKWGLIQNMELIKFRFNINFDLKDLEKFLRDLMNDKTIRKNFEPLNHVVSNDEERMHIEKIKYFKLGTKSTNTDLLNPMYENGICTRDGYIKKDYEDYYEEILIPDKLKQALLLEDSENYCIFNEEARSEFLFHIFKRLVIGGSLCQYDDYVSDYLQLTKLFYKGKNI